MATINGEWLARPKREQEIAKRRQLIEVYRELAENDDITEHDVDQWERADAELTKLERVHRAEYDLLYFMHEYFSDDMNDDNDDNLIPHGVSADKAADFHRELCGLLDEVAAGETQTNVSWVVGRGHAKTAYLSNGFLCHQVVFRHRRYIVEVSETTDVAGDFIKWTVNQLKYNRKLREDFGELLHIKPSMNEVDNKYEFVTKSSTKVEAKGIGTQMRGLRHGSTRPDLFLLDDLESKENTNTPEMRKKNRDWFREEMLPALSRKGMCVYMGTIVHYDSLLNYVVKQRKDFVSRKFPAILQWSEESKLWEQWRQLYRADAPNARDNARKFYESNRKEMTAGTQVLWQQWFTYLDLMEIRENDGSKAFNQEYLGNPIDEESQIFKPEEFTYFTDHDVKQREGFRYFCGVDFAMGKEKGDYSAIITIAKSPNNVCYVVDAFIERVHPDILLDEIVKRAIKYQHDAIAVEAQQAQEWFAHNVKQELQRKGYPGFTRVKEIKQRSRKALRIESLLPEIQSGKLRFKKEHRLLIEMFELYPNHNNDDGPDAIHMAFSTATNERKVRIIDKPDWL
jgi:predicted phage terminase large subunit-like protein